MRLRRTIKALPRGSVVVIGTDAPEVSACDVADAFQALGRFPAVFGPAVDGGYWLMGLAAAACADPPFAGVRWSTRHALQDTIDNLRHGPVALLRQIEDVDDGASFGRLACRRQALRRLVQV